MQLEILVRDEGKTAFAVIGVGDAVCLAGFVLPNTVPVKLRRKRAHVRPRPARASGFLDKRIDPDARRGEPKRLAAHLALVRAVPDIGSVREPAEILRHGLGALEREYLAVVGMPRAAAEKIVVDVGRVVRVINMRRGDLGASRKRHGAPVPVRHHVAYLHAAAVADHKVRARPVMVPGRFDRIPRRTAENEFRAASVKLEVFKPVDHDGIAEAAVDAGREQNFRRTDALRLAHCRRNCRAVVVVRHRKAEILRFENDASVRPRRGDGDFTSACRIGTKRRRSVVLAERNRIHRGKCAAGKTRRTQHHQHVL